MTNIKVLWCRNLRRRSLPPSSTARAPTRMACSGSAVPAAPPLPPAAQSLWCVFLMHCLVFQISVLHRNPQCIVSGSLMSVQRKSRAKSVVVDRIPAAVCATSVPFCLLQLPMPSVHSARTACKQEHMKRPTQQLICLSLAGCCANGGGQVLQPLRRREAGFRFQHQQDHVLWPHQPLQGQCAQTQLL